MNNEEINVERTSPSEYSARKLLLLLFPSALLALSLLLAGCEPLTPVDKPMDKPKVPPKLSIADATVPEGNSGTSDAVFSVTLSAATSETVTVAFATADGTATAAADYQAANGTLTFPAGQTAVHITVAVIGDIVREADETFAVTPQQPGPTPRSPMPRPPARSPTMTIRPRRGRCSATVPTTVRRWWWCRRAAS